MRMRFAPARDTDATRDQACGESTGDTLRPAQAGALDDGALPPRRLGTRPAAIAGADSDPAFAVFSDDDRRRAHQRLPASLPALRCAAPGNPRQSGLHVRRDLHPLARAAPRIASPEPAADRGRRAVATSAVLELGAAAPRAGIAGLDHH